MDIKIVIGANFGDEGKGLMTDYFANLAQKQHKKCIVVCHNGGAQRGHTVVTQDGRRHVFHHFGSGLFAGADTYLGEKFFVNPILFQRESEELLKQRSALSCFVNENAMVTVPYDMLINQILEQQRGKKKHGSCGMGIFEALQRSKTSYAVTMTDLKQDTEKLKAVIKKIQTEYVPQRLQTEGVTPSEDFRQILESPQIIEHFIEDCRFMLSHTKLVKDTILKNYSFVIFEGGQGLLLDQNNWEYMPHLTPSNTGIKNPIQIIRKLLQNTKQNIQDVSIEACYVSRCYLTRHGAGRMDYECRKEEINAHMLDKTNIPNPYQDMLRYGKLDYTAFINRIMKDSRQSNIPMEVSIAFTHCNETGGKLAEKQGFIEIPLKNQNRFSAYLSNGEDRSSIYKIIKKKSPILHNPLLMKDGNL